jgi:hypothetical protein
MLPLADLRGTNNFGMPCVFEDGFNLFDPLFLDSVPDPGFPISFLDPIFHDVSTFDRIGQLEP